MNRITYTSDQPADYAKAIAGAATLPYLVQVLTEYRSIAADALRAAPQNDAEFKAWRTGLSKERKRQFAGEDFARRFGAVLMPEVMLRVCAVAEQFGAPWGATFLTMQERGHIAFGADGVAVLAKKGVSA